MTPEVKEAVERFLRWQTILYGTGCMGGWGSRPTEFEKDVQAGIVLANHIKNTTKNIG